MNRLRVLIWHIHGSYLNALARVDHDWFLPVKAGRPEGYGGRGATFDLPHSVHMRDHDLVDMHRFLRRSPLSTPAC